MKTVQLKLTKKSIESKMSQMILNKFIEACTSLDASIFEPFIKENQVFQDLDKYRFLQLMKEHFQRCKAVGINFLRMNKATCMGCQNGHQTYEFFDGPQMRFAYVVLYQGEEISDIFQCFHSSSVFDESSFPF